MMFTYVVVTKDGVSHPGRTGAAWQGDYNDLKKAIEELYPDWVTITTNAQ